MFLSGTFFVRRFAEIDLTVTVESNGSISIQAERGTGNTPDSRCRKAILVDGF